MTRNNEPSYRKKGLSVFLTVLMVLSVVAMSAAFVGSVAAADHQQNLAWDDWTSDDDFWQGQELIIDDFGEFQEDGDEPDAIRLYNGTAQAGEEGDAVHMRDIRVQDNVSDVINTDDLHGAYHMVLEYEDDQGETHTDRSSTMWFSVQDVEFEFAHDFVRPGAEDANAFSTLTWEEDNRGDEVTLAITGDRDGNELTETELNAIFEDSTHDGHNVTYISGQSVGAELATEFDTPGEYNFTVSVNDSTAADDVSIEVGPFIETEIDFGDIENQAEGDVVSIPLEFEEPTNLQDDEIYVWINESDNYGVELELQMDEGFDAEEVVIEFNTYLAGQGDQPNNDAFSTANENVTINVLDQTEIHEDFRLNPAGYTLGVFETEQTQNRIDSATFTLMERHTGDATTHVVPTQWLDEVDGDDTDAEIMSQMLDNSSELDDVAEGDLLIVEQDVSGVFGYAVSDGEFMSISEANDSFVEAGLDVHFENLESPPYQHPASFNLDEDPDEQLLWVTGDQSEQSVYFVIIVTGDLLEEEGGLQDGDVKEWEYTFDVTASNAYIADEDAAEHAYTEYTVTERSVEIGVVEDDYQVTPTEDAEIRGTSTLAPGTNLTVEVDYPGFFFDQDRTVQVELNEEGERVWSYHADYSEYEVGEEFSIYVEETFWAEEFWPDPAFYAWDEADGIFADTPEWETLTTIAQLEQQIADLEEQIAALEEERDDLQAALDAALQERDDAQDALDGAMEQIDDLEQQVEDLQQQNQELQDENQELQDQIDELTEDDDENPAFGPIAALFALLAGGALIARRRLA